MVAVYRCTISEHVCVCMYGIDWRRIASVELA
jgi:hypothetical protein